MEQSDLKQCVCFFLMGGGGGGWGKSNSVLLFRNVSVKSKIFRILDYSVTIMLFNEFWIAGL
jgi:hypothetical protein